MSVCDCGQYGHTDTCAEREARRNPVKEAREEVIEAARALLKVTPHTRDCAEPSGFRPERCTCEVGRLARALDDYDKETR